MKVLELLKHNCEQWESKKGTPLEYLRAFANTMDMPVPPNIQVRKPEPTTETMN